MLAYASTGTRRTGRAEGVAATHHAPPGGRRSGSIQIEGHHSEVEQGGALQQDHPNPDYHSGGGHTRRLAGAEVRSPVSQCHSIPKS